MTICYFGRYLPGHTRNLVNLRGLAAAGVTVVECQTEHAGWRGWLELIRKLGRVPKDCRMMIVGFPGYRDMPLAWVWARASGRRIIFDFFTSAYDSYVLDRQSVAAHSPRAYWLWWRDWLACHLADVVLVDADAHANFVAREFNVRRDRVKTLLISCDDTVMYPRTQPKSTSKSFLVHFHGTYIPTQGIADIVRAASLLAAAGIQFRLVGRRDHYQPMMRLAEQLGATNCEFVDFVPYETLASLMSEADVCLGMFGDTAKARRVAAFKVTEGLAMGIPVVTADTPAMREFFTDRQNIVFCRLADAGDLAEKILWLKDHPAEREAIGQAGRELFQRTMTPRAVGKQLAAMAEQLRDLPGQPPAQRRDDKND